MEDGEMKKIILVFDADVERLYRRRRRPIECAFGIAE